MASTNLDEIGVRPLSVPDWRLGINTAKPPTEIEDNEAQDILNFEFDLSGNLSTRRGVTVFEATEYITRITSLYYFTAESGEVGILFTTGTDLYLINTNGTGRASLTGALTLPGDTFWQWVTYGGIAIGVNQSTTAANPVKVSGLGVASALGGTPPKGKYIQVWNNRVWIASATEPNQLRGSKLGDPEDWTTVTAAIATVTIDIDADDGDEIMGLHATRAALFVFKRRKIYRVVPINPAAAPTVAENLKVELYTKNIGCVSGYSIFNATDDVLFLSQGGLASLNLAATAEDFRTALISRNVAEIARTPKSTHEIPAFVLPDVSQYWLSIPASVSLTTMRQMFVLDYASIYEGVGRWTRFDGYVSGTAFTSFDGNTGKIYIIGAENAAGDHQLFLYKAMDTASGFIDEDQPYTKQLKTKSYVVGFPLLRKEWQKWAYGFNLLTNTVQIAIQYYFDQIVTKGGAYSFNLSATGEGALWDGALWDVAEWDTAVTIPGDIVRQFLVNSSGRRSQDITFLITNAQADQGMIIKHFMLWFGMLTEKGVSEV